MVIGEFAFLSSKLLLAKEEGRGKYQPTRQRGNEARNNKATNGGEEGSKGIQGSEAMCDGNEARQQNKHAAHEAVKLHNEATR